MAAGAGSGGGSRVANAFAAFKMELPSGTEVSKLEQGIAKSMASFAKTFEREREKAQREANKARLNAEKQANRDFQKEMEKAAKDQAKAASAAAKEAERQGREFEKARKASDRDAAKKMAQDAKDKKDQRQKNVEGAAVVAGGIAGGSAQKLMALRSVFSALGASSASAFVAGAAVGLTALAAVIAKKSFETAAERQTDSFRRDRMNKQGGNGTGWSNDQMDAMAKKVAELGTNSEKAAVKAQTAVMAFRNIKGDQFKRVVELSADVAAVMGTDMPSAAAKLGKALDDPISAAEGGLEDLGVQFNMLEQAQVRAKVAARDYAGAQNLILAKLDAFKGADAEFGKTAEGQWKKLQNNVEQLGEKIGKMLIPYVMRMVDWLIEAANYGEFLFSSLGDHADIGLQAIWVGFLELGDHVKDVFLFIAGVWWGTMKAIGAAAQWGWDKVSSIWNDKDAGHLGDKMAEAFEEGLNDALSLVGKTDAVKEAEDKLKKMTDALAEKRRKFNREKDKGVDGQKPAGAGTRYENTRSTFSFETSGFAELGKKIQSQIMPSEIVSKLDMQNKIGAEQVGEQKKANDFLSKVAQSVAAMEKKPAAPAKFGN